MPNPPNAPAQQSQSLNDIRANPPPSADHLHNSSPSWSDIHNSDAISSPVYLSAPSSRQPSRINTPLQHGVGSSVSKNLRGKDEGPNAPEGPSPDYLAFDDDDAWGEPDNITLSAISENHLNANRNNEAYVDPTDLDMPCDLRTNGYGDGRLHTPLLSSKGENYDNTPKGRPALGVRKSTFHERDPDVDEDLTAAATRKRYTYAAFFLVLSLISFTVQTETAVYIQHNLRWNKAYAMLYFTHGSWSMLWFLQLAILRLQKWSMPWSSFWRRHVQILRQTALMVQHQNVNAPTIYANQSPWSYLLRTLVLVTISLTVAGGSWYVAVDMTTASDLTAIYNCSAFFAYAFSIPLLHEKVRLSKVIAVGIAIIGVFVVAYGDAIPAKHGSKSGGGAGGPNSGSDVDEDDGSSNRLVGNVVIGVGSILYGLYEVLYKKMACPPDGTSPGRSMIFANFWGTCMGLFTLTVLWIPLPILHYTGLEVWELPRGEAAWMLCISVFANAIFSGSFLVLISLTSPVLSSVAALLTIFLVALVDQLLPPPLNSPLSAAAVAGGVLIIGAFIVLSWATYKEMDEERRKKEREREGVEDSDVEGEGGY